MTKCPATLSPARSLGGRNVMVGKQERAVQFQRQLNFAAAAAIFTNWAIISCLAEIPWEQKETASQIFLQD